MYKYFFAICFFTITLPLPAQDSTKIAQKILVNSYSGGRFGYSGIYLKLYNDSTYSENRWLHTGHTSNSKGKYQIIDSTIYFCPDNEPIKKNFKNCSAYRIRGDKILLYTTKQEKSKRKEYYVSYYALLKD